LRQRVSARLLGKLHKYLLALQQEVLPKSPSDAAVRYALADPGALHHPPQWVAASQLETVCLPRPGLSFPMPLFPGSLARG